MGGFPPPKIENFLPNLLKPHGEFWQKSDFHALFAIFLAENRIKTFFINKISLEVDECSILCPVSVGKSYEILSAKILRLCRIFIPSHSSKQSETLIMDKLNAFYYRSSHTTNAT
jgi:hypothetical protein